MSRDYEQTATAIVRENYRLRGSYTRDMINEIAAALRAEHLAALREAREIALSQRLMPVGHRHDFADAREHDDIVDGVAGAIDRLIAEKESETDGDE